MPEQTLPVVPDEPPQGPALRVGLIYNLKRIKPSLDGAHDEEAEYDSEHTVAAIEGGIRSAGHDVVRIEATPEIFATLPKAGLELAFNMAEGWAGRSREALVPVMLDALGIEFVGSDAATMMLTLDKSLAKAVVRDAGLRTPAWQVLLTGDEPLSPALRFPLIAKPVAEGSSKGVTAASVVHDEAGLRALTRTLCTKYRQGVLVERYLPGREFTVAVLDWPVRRALPILEIAFTDRAPAHPVYEFAHKQQWDDAVRYDVPADIGPDLRARIEALVLAAFAALGCRDVARIDVRLDDDGEPSFIECNPLPGLTPRWSDLCLIAEAAGIEYNALIRAILQPAVARRAAVRSLP